MGVHDRGCVTPTYLAAHATKVRQKPGMHTVIIHANAAQVNIQVVNGSSILNNRGRGTGGAISINVQQATSLSNAASTLRLFVLDSTLTGNVAASADSEIEEAAEGGGAIFVSWPPMDVGCSFWAQNVSFESNSCRSGSGGAVSLNLCTARLESVVLVNNTSPGGSGGAVSAVAAFGKPIILCVRASQPDTGFCHMITLTIQTQDGQEQMANCSLNAWAHDESTVLLSVGSLVDKRCATLAPAQSVMRCRSHAAHAIASTYEMCTPNRDVCTLHITIDCQIFLPQESRPCCVLRAALFKCTREVADDRNP